MRFNKILISLVIALFILGTTVLGYSTDSYDITISDSYQVIEQSGMVMFQNETTGDNIVVQEIDQKIIGGKLSNYQLNSITEEIVNQYKTSYDAEVEQLGKEETTINEKNVVRMTYKITIGDIILYQELNIFIGSEKLYDVIFTKVSEEGFSQEEKDSILNSFVIKEEISSTEEASSEDMTLDEDMLVSGMNMAWTEAGILMLIMIILVFVAIKRNPKSKLYIISMILFVLQVGLFEIVESQNGSLENVTKNVVSNIIYLIFTIIAIILLIVQIAKKPKNETSENEEVIKDTNADKKQDEKEIEEKNDDKNPKE